MSEVRPENEPESPNAGTPEDSFEPDPPEKVDEAERVIRQAHFAKQKGQNTLADRLLKEAQEIAPNTASVLEAVGDDFAARGQYRKAKEVYARAHKLDPSVASIENKFGEMVLRVDLHIDPTTYSDSETMASAKAAVFLSLFFPGVGQMVTGRIALGAAMLAIWGISLVALITLPGGLGALIQSLTKPADVSPLTFLLLPAVGFAWLWSIFDASIKAKRATPRVIERPVMPDESLF